MLDDYIADIERRRTEFTVYSPEDTGLAEQLATRNATVEHRPLSPVGPPPFVAIRRDETFVGALDLAELRELLAPPVVRPGEWEGLAEGYRALLGALEETVFTGLTRRQLLATSREIEDRAYRVGSGVLRVCFQSLSAFASQTKVYRHLADVSDLEIHVYGEPDWSPPAAEGITYHRDAEGRLAPFWSVAFDGGPDDSQACVLVAREREDGFVGFWSYDPDLVSDVLDTLETAGL